MPTCRLAARAHKSSASSTGTSLLLSMAHSAASANTCTAESLLELLELHSAAMHVEPFPSQAEQPSPGISVSVAWPNQRFQVHAAHENAKLPQQATCRHAHLIHAAERQAGDVRDNNCSHGRVRDLLQSLRNCPGCSCHDP